MIEKKEIFKGTYKFCTGCPIDKNCCTGKAVELPVITRAEARYISLVKGLPEYEYSIRSTNNLRELKAINDRCYFYQRGKCSIYNQRPIDCRLYPFDIYKDSSERFLLISYTNACPKPINISRYIRTAKSLLRHLGPYLKEYAEYNTPLLNEKEYRVIATIYPTLVLF